MVEDPFVVAYSVSVLLLGGWFLLRVRRALRRGERSRRADLAARSEGEFEAIRATYPPKDTSARLRGLRSIESRFTVHRRLVTPMVVVLTLGLAALPLLSAIPATLLSVLVALVTVAVGVAARPVLENTFAGLMMSFSRVIRIGDTVRIGAWYGSIEDISATHTTIQLWDWRRYIVPNSLIVQKEIINYSIFDQRLWAHVEFWVSWNADIELVRQLAREAAEASAYCESDEPPSVWVMSTDKEAVGLWVAAWASDAGNAWMLSEDIRTRLIEAFQKHGIATHDHRALVHGQRVPLTGEPPDLQSSKPAPQRRVSGV